MTQNEQILRHMQVYGSITPMDALQEYGIMRLGARICDLKQMGYKIRREIVHGRNRFGEKTRWAKYELEVGQPCEDQRF